MRQIKKSIGCKPLRSSVIRNHPLRGNVGIAGYVTIVYLMTLTACTAPTDEIEAVDTPREIIGGHAAASSALDHTGALIISDGYDFEPCCSATLIGPKTVVTAKHCAEYAYWGYDVYFGIGPDAYLPDELIQAVAVDRAPQDDGGFMGLGQDVAVFQLASAPSDGVDSAIPMPSSALNVGERMINIGYGVFTARDNHDGVRRIGRETVVSTEGLGLEALLGDFESFVEWFITGETTEINILDEISEEDIEYFLEIYEEELLLTDYEAVTGGEVGDTQSCYGDSGGPLMKYVPGSGWQLFGVVSGGLDSANSVCDYGTIFAVFGPDVISFLNEARDWVDPCADLGNSGRCDGNTAVNCVTDLSQGIRRLFGEDCDTVGQTCIVENDQAYCGSAPPSSEQGNREVGIEDLGSAVEAAAKDAFFYRF